MDFEPTAPRKRSPRGTLDRAQAVATAATVPNSDTDTARGIGTCLGAAWSTHTVLDPGPGKRTANVPGTALLPHRMAGEHARPRRRAPHAPPRPDAGTTRGSVTDAFGPHFKESS